MLFLAGHERWLGLGREPRHTWHHSPQLPHCPWGRGSLLLLLLTRLEHSFLLIHPRECSGPSWGRAGALGGHLGHGWPGVDGS